MKNSMTENERILLDYCDEQIKKYTRNLIYIGAGSFTEDHVAKIKMFSEKKEELLDTFGLSLKKDV